MFIYLNSIKENSLNFVEFVAEGRSVTDVATMFQKGMLKEQLISSCGSQLIVKLLNPEEYHFSSDTKYYLVFQPAKVAGYLEISCFYEGDKYVPTYMRRPLAEITQDTWRQLFKAKPARHYTMILAKDNLPGLRPQKYEKVYLDEYESPKEIIIRCPSEDSEFGDNELPEPPTPDEEIVDDKKLEVQKLIDEEYEEYEMELAYQECQNQDDEYDDDGPDSMPTANAI